MYAQHLIRVGLLGRIGRFASADGGHYYRGMRVVCRTARGLEVGEVVKPLDGSTSETDGTLIRRLSVEDELLVARLEKHRQQAFRDCAQLLSDRSLAAILVDVEQTFDGQSVFFYFLGEVDSELEGLTAELAETYDMSVQFRQFSDTLVHGCGPGCGTEEAAGNGCATGGCASCAVACAAGK